MLRANNALDKGHPEKASQIIRLFVEVGGGNYFLMRGAIML